MSRTEPTKDTEAKATYRFMMGGFGKLGSKAAYKRYSAYIDLLYKRKPINRRDWIGYIFVPDYEETTQ